MKNQYSFLRLLFFSIISLLLVTISNAQVIEEGFESWPPAFWTVEPASGNGSWVQNNGDIPTPGGNAGPGMAYEGEYAAMYNNYDYLPEVTGSMTSPTFELSSLETPMVHFYWWNNDAPLEPARVVVQSSNDGINFTSLDTIACIGSGETTWIEYYHLLNADDIQIRIFGISDYGLKNTYIDAFSIAEAPTCLQPSNLTVNNITPNSADIDWTMGNDETAWIVEFGIAGFEIGTGTTISADSHPISLEDLSSNTNYEFYVKSDCDDEVSPWAGPLAFTTVCEVITAFPWVEGFENGNLGCFSIQQSNPVETWYWTDELAFIGPYAGEGYARIAYSLSAQDEWMISPVLDLSGVSAPSLSFYWSLSYIFSMDPNDNYDLIVKVTTDGENWTNIWDESMVGVFENWIYYEQIIDLQEYQGEPSFQFAFNYVGIDGAAAYIDEVLLDIETAITNSDPLEINTQLYPNPSSTLINIDSKEAIHKVSIYNMMGQLMNEYMINEVHHCQIPLHEIPNGNYYLKIQTETNQESKLIHVFH